MTAKDTHTPEDPWQQPPPDSISSIAQDYVKAIWSATEWGGAAITTKALAERFGTTAATASDTIKRLAAQGLLVHEPYKSITLTPAGERQALAMVRRHRLIEAFLETTLDYSWAEVHNEAENLEHSVSDLMIERIDKLLGHPATDPHGDPIPARDGTIRRVANAIQLTEAAPGAYRVVRVSDADADRLSLFDERGLLPGALVTVAEWDPRSHTVLIDLAEGRELALARAAAEAIMVAAVSADAEDSTPL